jgi:hypothetical protein
MNSRHKEYLGDLYKYVEKIEKTASTEDKKIIIWGYAKGGAFISWLLKNVNPKCKIDYIIDDGMDLVINGEPKIYRSSIFDYIDNKQYIVLSTILDFKLVKEKLSEYGYLNGKNLFNIRGDIGLSYIDFLQINNSNIDFSNTTEKDRPDIYVNTDNAISTPFETISVDELFQAIKELEDEISFFDYGCGKGQVLFDAFLNGVDNLAGIELVESIANQACENLKELKIPANVICGDATVYKNIDDINVFFFNNPFGGDVFKKVIDNIEDSWRRKPRRIHIVYLNVRCHNKVIEHGIFKLDKQMYIACGDPLANFYVTVD